MKRIVVAVVFIVASLPLLTAMAEAQPYDTPSPAPPPEGQTIGERNPLVAAAAAVGIILTGIAGIYIYRTIKKGL